MPTPPAEDAGPAQRPGPQAPVVILSASAGAGHLVAAQALAEAFREQCPRRPTVVRDVLELAAPGFRTLYAGGYLWIVRYVPALMGWLYDVVDRPCRPADAVRRTIEVGCLRRAARWLVAQRPALVVCTHFLPAEMVAWERRRGRLHCPQVIVTTDFETHRIWIQEPAERYHVATTLGRDDLCGLGVDPQRIRVSGIPVRSGFEPPPLERGPLREALGLSAERPVVLILCGGFGVGPAGRVLEELKKVSRPLQIVVIAGRNERLRRRLSACRPGAHGLHVLGYTERVHEWMQAADLLISKPGGLTSAEALACGLPLVIVQPIPGQEARNSDFLLESGAAIRVNNLRLLAARVGRLLADPARLAAMRQAALRAARPQAAEQIAGDALELIGERPEGSLAARPVSADTVA